MAAAFPIYHPARHHYGLTMVAEDFLQDPRVREWLDGVEPAWTLLTFASLRALREQRSMSEGPIRFATDLTDDEIMFSVVQPPCGPVYLCQVHFRNSTISCVLFGVMALLSVSKRSVGVSAFTEEAKLTLAPVLGLPCGQNRDEIPIFNLRQAPER
jgi:hypothetical protein